MCVCVCVLWQHDEMTIANERNECSVKYNGIKGHFRCEQMCLRGHANQLEHGFPCSHTHYTHTRTKAHTLCVPSQFISELSEFQRNPNQYNFEYQLFGKSTAQYCERWKCSATKVQNNELQSITMNNNNNNYHEMVEMWKIRECAAHYEANNYT